MITNAMSAAVGGMNAQATRFLHIGNNIANSSTTGYKSGDAVFAETLALVSGKAPNGARLQPGAGVAVMGTVSDFSTGQLLDDTNPFHLAIQGDGFLSVTVGQQDYVSRAGDFSLVPNPDGTAGEFVMMRPNGAQLQGTTTLGGALVSGDGGRVVFESAPASVEIDVDGTITATDVAGAPVVIQNPFVGLRNFVNPDALKKEAAQMYTTTTEASPISATYTEPGTAGTGFLRQSALEQSNVDLTNEFTKMIVSQRNFQANAKTITTADEMLNTAINVKR
ncbi:MAG: flagellar hook basal-body protein [Lentisphaeraceae bacterium]|nr:flagellar hook basal-body protein [Lentisphaeraceae bacterium]